LLQKRGQPAIDDNVAQLIANLLPEKLQELVEK
jgi:hypothetical protein